jgi:hypothetical protein
MLFFSKYVHYEGIAGETAGSIAVAVLLGLAIISMLRRSGGRESQTMPRYFLTLPIRSGFWSALHFGYGVCMLAILALALAMLHLYLFGGGAKFALNFQLSPWKFVLCIAAFGALLEGVFLLAGSADSPILTVAALGAALVLFAGATMVAADADSRETRSREAAIQVASRPRPPTPERPVAATSGLARGRSPSPPAQPGMSKEEQIARQRAMAGKTLNELRVKQWNKQSAELRGKRDPRRRQNVEYRAGFGPPYVVWVWSALLILGYVLSHIGTLLYRHGSITAEIEKSGLVKLFMHYKRDDAFRSPDDAVIWFEWKRLGRYLPWATCIFALCCAPMCLLHGNSMRDFVGVYAGFLISSAVGLGTYMTIRHHWDHTSGFNAFIFTLPISTYRLASVRMRMSVRSVLISLLVAGVGLLVFALPECLDYVLRVHGPVGIPVMFLEFAPDAFAVVASILAAMLIALWLPIPIFYAAMGLLLLIIGFLTPALGLKEHGPENAAMMVIAGTMTLASLGTVWCAYRSGSLPGSGWLKMLALSSAAACACYVLLRGEFQDPLKSLLFACLLAALVLLSTVPFASVPLSINWYRHR